MWNNPESVKPNNLNKHINRLRDKLGSDFLKTNGINKYSLASDETSQPAIMAYGINITDNDLVFVNGEECSLFPKELEILTLLMSQPDAVFSKGLILENLFLCEADQDKDPKYVDVQISNLNKKLAAASASDTYPDGYKFIENVWGKGYRMMDEPVPYAKQIQNRGLNPNQSRPPSEAAAEGFEEDGLTGLDTV